MLDPSVFQPRNTHRPDSTTNTALQTLHELGIETDLPKNHRMAILETRLDTFGTWPTDKTQGKNELAEAGFFYIGKYYKDLRYSEVIPTDYQKAYTICMVMPVNQLIHINAIASFLQAKATV